LKLVLVSAPISKPSRFLQVLAVKEAAQPRLGKERLPDFFYTLKFEAYGIPFASPATTLNATDASLPAASLSHEVAGLELATKCEPHCPQVRLQRSCSSSANRRSAATLLCVKLYLPPEILAWPSGRSAAWLARLVRDQEVEGSNPFAPTTSFRASNLRHIKKRKTSWLWSRHSFFKSFARNPSSSSEFSVSPCEVHPHGKSLMSCGSLTDLRSPRDEAAVHVHFRETRQAMSVARQSGAAWTAIRRSRRPRG
jgi:hypothetical protein